LSQIKLIPLLPLSTPHTAITLGCQGKCRCSFKIENEIKTQINNNLERVMEERHNSDVFPVADSA